jgi:hypothetical protein
MMPSRLVRDIAAPLPRPPKSGWEPVDDDLGDLNWWLENGAGWSAQAAHTAHVADQANPVHADDLLTVYTG